MKNNIEEIKKNLQSILSDENELNIVSVYKEIREDYVKEYGINKFNKLDLEQYTNIKDEQKDYFSRKVEQKKYKYLMPTIGQIQSEKYLIYKKKDTKQYTIGSERKDIKKKTAEEAWERLREYINDYMKMLKNVKDASELKVREYFSLENLNQILGGQYIVDVPGIDKNGRSTTKSTKAVINLFYKLIVYMLNQVYPEKFVGFRSEDKCKVVEEFLGIVPEKEYTIVERTFAINKYIRNNIEEFNNQDPYILFKAICKTIPDFLDIKETEENMMRELGKLTTSNQPIQINNLVKNLLPIKNLNESLKISDENCEKNQIFYGAPGCGKSYKIEEILNKNKKAIAKSIRILFHPDYSYTDFIGQLQPEIIKKEGEEDKVTYKFIPGPFTELLKEAINDKENKNYVLIIDEINRGNAPAIFGDIFQLLDRNEEGKSIYSIKNSMISDEIYDKEQKNEIRLPENFYIFATMNTSDQNVFTLDTAFKRRWYFEKISNKFRDKEMESKYTCDLGQQKIAGTDKKWKDFQNEINEIITNKLFDYGIDGEDKQLGKHFVTKEDLNNKKKFAYKVLMYLWEDAVKIDRRILFKEKYTTLDQVIEDFIGKEGIDVFNFAKGEA